MCLLLSVYSKPEPNNGPQAFLFTLDLCKDVLCYTLMFTH